MPSSGGSSIATRAMRARPVGVPKLMVSTVASGDTRPYVGAVDVTMMYSVVDIAGVNRVSARIMAYWSSPNAAATGTMPIRCGIRAPAASRAATNLWIVAGRTFVKFTFFKLDPAWRRRSPEERATDKAEFLAACDDFAEDRSLPPEERFAARLNPSMVPRNSAAVRIRNRCQLSGRPRGYYRKFKLSRIALRDLASSGQTPGMVKSSW